MRKLILLISMLILSSLLFTSVVTAKTYTPQFLSQAETLKELGLFMGTNTGFELERQPTRLEAVIMLIRLLGLESEAEQETGEIPFTDVPGWGKSYVAYAFKNKLTFGISDQEFGSSSFASESQFLTFVLRSLGYDDSKGDFLWSAAFDKALEAGLLTQEYLQNKPEEFLRDGCVAISTQALKTNLKDKNELLLSKLLDRGVVVESKIHKVLSEAESYAFLAEKSYQKRQVGQAETNYLKAVDLDPLQAKYQAGLAKIYDWMVRTSGTKAEKDSWNEKLRTASVAAVNLAPQNPEYVSNLMKFYFTQEDFENALLLAEQYFPLAKKQEEAYEWLARGYNEYGLQLLQENNLDEAKILLKKSMDLLNVKSLSNNKTVMFYAGRSYLAFGKFKEAESLLQKTRTFQDFKSHSDWLLYLINEETGRSAENEKYRGLVWMGSVLSEPKTNTEYLEMKRILESKVLT